MTLQKRTNKTKPVPEMVDGMMEYFKQLAIEAGEPHKSIAERKTKQIKG